MNRSARDDGLADVGHGDLARGDGANGFIKNESRLIASHESRSLRIHVVADFGFDANS